MAEQVRNHRENLLQHVYPLQQSDRVPTWTNAIGRKRERGGGLVTRNTFQLYYTLKSDNEHGEREGDLIQTPYITRSAPLSDLLLATSLFLFH